MLESGKRFGGIDIDEDRVVVHFDFGDQLGMLADQIPGADIAGDLVISEKKCFARSTGLPRFPEASPKRVAMEFASVSRVLFSGPPTR